MILEQPRAYAQYLVQSVRRIGRKFWPGQLWAFIFQNTPAELTLVPQDLRTVDPVLAEEYYNGIYSFGLIRVDTKGRNPFQLPLGWENVSVEWLCELHSFGWLRHLQSSQNAIHHSHAQSLVADWIKDWGKPGSGIAWQPDIVAKRLISWLSHSVLIVDKAELSLYRKFLYSIGTHIRYLDDNFYDAPDGLPRLQVRIALAYGALCVGYQRRQKSGQSRKPHERLGVALAHQIFADGGHISRCSSLLPEILVDLLPLRQSYERLGIEPPHELTKAIDRMMPAIRYYRHRDGSFARFNGVGASQHELIATVLRYDDAMGQPAQEASHSGYQRLTGGATTLIMDTGRPPKGELSNQTHAGCLSFEMSSLRSSIITNCGAPHINDGAIAVASRSTAAHSTATLHNTSSCRFHKKAMFKRHPGNRILAAPARVISERKKLDGFTRIIARHDGYLRQFGIWHERILQLSDDGTRLYGRDRFFVDGGKRPIQLGRDDCAIRFHLHPALNVQIENEGAVIAIRASDNHIWNFTTDGGQVGIEESVYLATAGPPRTTSQIVINLNISQLSTVNWRFEQSVGTRLERK